MKTTFIAVCLLCLAVTANAQDYVEERKSSPLKKTEKKGLIDRNQPISFGAGIGNPYGGIGISLGYSPWKHILISTGFGYFLFDIGYQAGFNLYAKSRNSAHIFRPFLRLMYGTNLYLYVNENGKYGRVNLRKVYKGYTVGFGTELRFGKYRRNGINVQLCVPIPSREAQNDMDYVRNQNIDLIYVPIDLAIAFHHEF